MTRVNLIPVEELTDQHLLSEHREIKRIPNVIASGRYSLKGMPNEFKLGTGHVKFFYNKLNFLFYRYMDLYKECKNRGFNVEFYGGSFRVIREHIIDKLDNDYTPTPESIQISRDRINEKIAEKPGFYRKNGVLL